MSDDVTNVPKHVPDDVTNSLWRPPFRRMVADFICDVFSSSSDNNAPIWKIKKPSCSLLYFLKVCVVKKILRPRLHPMVWYFGPVLYFFYCLSWYLFLSYHHCQCSILIGWKLENISCIRLFCQEKVYRALSCLIFSVSGQLWRHLCLCWVRPADGMVTSQPADDHLLVKWRGLLTLFVSSCIIQVSNLIQNVHLDVKAT